MLAFINSFDKKTKINKNQETLSKLNMKVTLCDFP